MVGNGKRFNVACAWLLPEVLAVCVWGIGCGVCPDEISALNTMNLAIAVPLAPAAMLRAELTQGPVAAEDSSEWDVPQGYLPLMPHSNVVESVGVQQRISSSKLFVDDCISQKAPTRGPPSPEAS